VWGEDVCGWLKIFQDRKQTLCAVKAKAGWIKPTIKDVGFIRPALAVTGRVGRELFAR
jgi:hypothetical protein